MSDIEGSCSHDFCEHANEIARAAVAAFNDAAAACGASGEERQYAAALFTHMLAEQGDFRTFKLVCLEDALYPGMVSNTFAALDEWYTNCETTVLAQRATALLADYGDCVSEIMREHWASLASKKE